MSMPGELAKVASALAIKGAPVPFVFESVSDVR